MGEALRRRIKQESFESPVQEALLNLLVAANHLRERFNQEFARYGITLSQYNVLRILKGVYPQGHSRGEIARRMLERAPDVTRLIGRLEKRGLVERLPSEEDGRLSIARITPKGLKLLEEMRTSVDALHAYFAERVVPPDQHELSRICEAIYEEREF